jgi:FkbM family methyltransferase
MKPTHEDVRFAYRIFLRREPEDQQRCDAIAAASLDIANLFWNFVYSAEFANTRMEIRDRTVGAEIFAEFANPESRESEPGFIRDFLGVKTDIGFLSHTAGRSGEVEGVPVPHNFHGSLAEWVGTLRSVLAAKAGERSEFNIMELGAGWGPWLVAGVFAARQQGFCKFHLTGVEGSKDHVKFLRQHLTNNGIDPGDHDIRHGVVGAKSELMYFPILTTPNHEWGAAPVTREKLPPKFKKSDYETVQAVSLNDLLTSDRRIDLLHVDIQGGELDTLAAAKASLNQKVAYVVIGTHGRGIEEGLFKLFAELKWWCEIETPCEVAQDFGGTYGMVLQWDGCQVWRNPKLLDG